MTDLRVSIHRHRYATIGYGQTSVPQVSAVVLLHKGEDTLTLWSECSHSSFCQYTAKSLVPAAKRYANKLANMLDLPRPVVWEGK